MLAEKEIELLRKKQLRARELCAAEQNAGAAFLAGRSAALDLITTLPAELGAIDLALKASRTLRLGAIADKVKIQAHQIREEIGSLQSELSGLDVKIQEHLDVLCFLEGIPVTAGIFVSRPDFDCKTNKLRTEIAKLEKTAADLERWTLPATGRADLSNLVDPEELLLAVLTHASDSPAAEAVLDWVDRCQEAALRRRGNAEFGDKACRYFLVWKDGSIDFERSYIFVRDLAHTTPAAMGQHFDIESATFRAETKKRS